MEELSQREMIQNYLCEVRFKLDPVLDNEEAMNIDQLKEYCMSLIDLADFLNEKLVHLENLDQETSVRLYEEISQGKQEIEYFRGLSNEYQNLYHVGIEKQNFIYENLTKIEEQLASQIDLNRDNANKHNFTEVEAQNKALCFHLQNIVEQFHQEGDQLKKEIKLTKTELTRVKQQNTELNLALEVSHKFVIQEQQAVKTLNYEKHDLVKKMQKLQEEIKPLMTEMQDQLASPQRVEYSMNYDNSSIMSLSQRFKVNQKQYQSNDQRTSNNQSYDQKSTSVLNLKQELYADVSNLDSKSWYLKTSRRQSLLLSDDDNQTPIHSFRQLKNTMKEIKDQKSFTNNIFMELRALTVEEQDWRIQNPYFDFFLLTSQCAKLNNSKNYKIFGIYTQNLYKDFILNKIPFNRWYAMVQNHLLEKLESM